MIAVLQRVKHAAVTVNGKDNGGIGAGLVVLLGVAEGDTREAAELLARKILACRIFEDENGKMNFSVKDIAGGVMVVSNFTLLANCRKGTRPDFGGAARPAEALPLYEYFIELIKKEVASVATGEFGADMQIDMLNDGPVTLVLESGQLSGPRRG